MAASRCFKLLLLVAACCTGPLSRAQQAVPAPLAPVRANAPVSHPLPPLPTAAAAATAAAPTLTLPTQALTSWPAPLYVLHSAVIMGPDLLGVQPDAIKELRIYKEQHAPQAWRQLTTYGIVDVFLKEKKKVKSRTFAKLGKQLGVSGPVRYTVNGMPVADPTLRVALAAIGEITITQPSPEAPVTTLAIRIKASPPRKSSPGIYIRGTAAR